LAETPVYAPGSVTPDFASSTIYFAYDDYSLTTEAQSELSKIGEYLKSNTTAVVQVEGHCDERGTVEYNLALGERRAQSVKSYLVNLGVTDARLATISYGEEKPAADGHDEAAWTKNRRAAFVLTVK
jgi:peptidoglycan-associated lipoprotein